MGYDIARQHCEEQCCFEWGKNDCVLWVCDYLKKIHGVDYAIDFRGKYNSQLGARRIMRAMGHDSAETLVDEYFPRKAIQYAKRGDLVLSPNKAMGICLGSWSYFLGTGGVVKLTTLTCTHAWSVE